MRFIIVALTLCAVLATASPAKYAVMFETFKKEYGRTYATPAEEANRFGIFVTNMKKAEKLHRLNPLASFGVNEFADISAAEFKVRHSAEKVFAALAAKDSGNVWKPSKEQERAAAGQAIDWRTKGAVTYVKNQGQCGSCWSFSSTGSIEGQWFLAGNTLTPVSEQELVSCDTTDDGCNGGWMDNAWAWLISARKGQIVTETSYPYVSGNGNVPKCDLTNKVVGATIDGHENIEKTETAMATWVYANGPLSVAVDATSWQTYTKGIMTNCISSQIDHGVLVVGFDDNNNPPYWIIKNSWGKSWGESGYIRVEKGKDECLITYRPCSSKVAGGPKPTTPGPSGATFTQRICSDDQCSNCTSDVLPQNTCISGKAGDSMKATCLNDGLLVTAYSSSDCSGSSTQTVDPINQCSAVFNSNQIAYFVENLCGSGPTPAPNSNTFTQMQCTGANCASGCKNSTYPLGKCIALADGGSAIAACTTTELSLTEYPLSTSCDGFNVARKMAVDQCLQEKDGSYIENFCNTGASRTIKRFGLKKN